MMMSFHTWEQVTRRFIDCEQQRKVANYMLSCLTKLSINYWWETIRILAWINFHVCHSSILILIKLYCFPRWTEHFSISHIQINLNWQCLPLWVFHFPKQKKLSISYFLVFKQSEAENCGIEAFLAFFVGFRSLSSPIKQGSVHGINSPLRLSPPPYSYSNFLWLCTVEKVFVLIFSRILSNKWENVANESNFSSPPLRIFLLFNDTTTKRKSRCLRMGEMRGKISTTRTNYFSLDGNSRMRTNENKTKREAKEKKKKKKKSFPPFFSIFLPS